MKNYKTEIKGYLEEILGKKYLVVVSDSPLMAVSPQSALKKSGVDDAVNDMFYHYSKEEVRNESTLIKEAEGSYKKIKIVAVINPTGSKLLTIPVLGGYGYSSNYSIELYIGDEIEDSSDVIYNLQTDLIRGLANSNHPLSNNSTVTPDLNFTRNVSGLLCLRMTLRCDDIQDRQNNQYLIDEFNINKTLEV
jgi:hypothetical protein